MALLECVLFVFYLSKFDLNNQKLATLLPIRKETKKAKKGLLYSPVCESSNIVYVAIGLLDICFIPNSDGLHLFLVYVIFSNSVLIACYFLFLM